MAKIKDNKGIILITTLMVATVLFILGGAYVMTSMVQNKAALREKTSMQAFYAAEQGIAYAFIESRSAGYAFYTHYVDTLDGNKLKPVGTAPTRKVTESTAFVANNYQINTPFGRVLLRAYKDPNPGHGDETIVLARGIDTATSATRTLKFRISRQSLYKSFMFWPNNLATGGNYNGKTLQIKQADSTYLTKNIGALHTNGDLNTGSGGTYTNFDQFSYVGKLYYSSSKYDNPLYWDRRKFNPVTRLFTDNYYTAAQADGYASIPRSGSSPYQPVITGVSTAKDAHFNGNSVSDNWDGTNPITTYGSLQVNGVQIPKQLPGASEYPWNKYGSNKAVNEVGIKYKVVDTDYGADKRYQNLQDLVDYEEYNSEYTWGNTNYLIPYETGNNGRWESNEYDRVTLLSQENEAGDGGSHRRDKGLDNASEYKLYKNVQNYATNGVFLLSGNANEISTEMQDWLTNKHIDTIPAFFEWWTERHYHQEDLVHNGSVYHFATDKDTIPAYERIFWEATANYWPPTVIASKRAAKRHDEVYHDDTLSAQDKQAAGANHILNAEWWNDLTYGNEDLSLRGTGENVSLNVKYLNTGETNQQTQFDTWLASTAIRDVVKQVPAKTPLKISDYYGGYAESNGLYIKETSLGNFIVKFNGHTSLEDNKTDLAACLADVGLGGSDTWVTNNRQFYNPEATNVAYSGTTPLPVKVIELDVDKLNQKITLAGDSKNIANHIIYIECMSYDTRIVNAATLPAGGLTLVTPFDVYLKAERRNIDGTTVSAFNYERTDKTHDDDAADINFKPAAVITNSRVYYLSSDFQDRSSVPYPVNFPRGDYSIMESKFLQDYCWNNWPAELVAIKPASQTNLNWALVQTFSSTDQKKILDYGQAQWRIDNAANIINKVNYDNTYNVAVATPYNVASAIAPYYNVQANGTLSTVTSGTYDMDPRGYAAERWSYYTNANERTGSYPYKKLTIEGAFIKLGEAFTNSEGQKLMRFHTDYNAYESSAARLGIAGCSRTNYAGADTRYEYEERFYSADGRPSADFFSGSQQRWQEVTQVDGFDVHYN